MCAASGPEASPLSQCRQSRGTSPAVLMQSARGLPGWLRRPSGCPRDRDDSV